MILFVTELRMFLNNMVPYGICLSFFLITIFHSTNAIGINTNIKITANNATDFNFAAQFDKMRTQADRFLKMSYRTTTVPRILQYIEKLKLYESKAVSMICLFYIIQTKELCTPVITDYTIVLKKILDVEPSGPLEKFLKTKLKEICAKLPISIKNAVFVEKNCVINVSFNESLYSYYKNDETNMRPALTWMVKEDQYLNTPESLWRFNVTSDGPCHKFNIENVEFGEHLVEVEEKDDTAREIVYTKSGDITSSDVKWTLGPSSDLKYAYIKSGTGHYMYPRQGQYDGQRRNIYTWTEDKNIFEEGRWHIYPC